MKRPSDYFDFDALMEWGFLFLGATLALIVLVMAFVAAVVAYNASNKEGCQKPIHMTQHRSNHAQENTQ